MDSLWRRSPGLAKQKPHRRFGSEVWEIQVNNSKPACRAAQQQRVQQRQSGIQSAIHNLTHRPWNDFSQTHLYGESMLVNPPISGY
jgi:hypothetical protein